MKKSPSQPQSRLLEQQLSIPNVLILQKDRDPGQSKPKDIPWKDLIARMEELAKEGHQVFLKWTCEKCKQRVMAEKPNQVSTQMKHDEPECGHITDVTKTGGGFVLVMRDLSLENATKYLERYSR